ncbi:hypothetical protein [Helicobacter suis]|uniref:hypothetical protein n=1 Tax=Helicobacter suis TaxID=104628 RepID=UPI001596F887|nr:hypothetical protein [Helicobacter suis]BCD51935.1 hypothetical protein NHP194022_16060 [Helicobacter suis]
MYGYVSRGLEQLENPMSIPRAKEILEKLENIATIKDFNTSTTNRLEKARTQVESKFKKRWHGK